ncbi:hypothetical protein DVR12_02765 [Chitinophaga silvatica]|uniref:Uncharacterized protein n=1 Tax=Chitinophaga silvatica TaxID=2282649 RepID=A0A3E1YH25_9BACT|nr:hypothetical protein DVR12_02765 [Chitinophaga silvatica]
MTEKKTGSFWEKLINIKNDSCCTPASKVQHPLEVPKPSEEPKIDKPEVKIDQSSGRCCS